MPATPHHQSTLKNLSIPLTDTFSGKSVGYTYDNIGQLKVADSSVNTEDRGYTYDAAWNLNYRTNNGTTQTFSVDTKNELTNAPDGVCTYDSNGNMLSSGGEGGIAYSYDDENRLESMEQYPVRIEFVYDGMGRLRKKLVYEDFADTWGLQSETRYVYDGWRVIQERNSGNTPTVSYTRGTDLSGSLEGAGGIGGLLARSHGYSGGTWSTHNFYFADGNGNILNLVNSSGTSQASYRYDPYGGTLSSSGTLADANVYRFSSKEAITIQVIHSTTQFYYYGYRFYSPSWQRWVNRDRIPSKNGNLHHFCWNDAIERIDVDGLKWRVTGYPARAGDNTIVCEGGKPSVQLSDQWKKPVSFEQTCIQDCAFHHEESHIRDVKAQDPDICKGIKDDFPHQIVNYDPIENAESEVRAYEGERDCLAECAKGCKDSLGEIQIRKFLVEGTGEGLGYWKGELERLRKLKK